MATNQDPVPRLRDLIESLIRIRPMENVQEDMKNDQEDTQQTHKDRLVQYQKERWNRNSEQKISPLLVKQPRQFQQQKITVQPIYQERRFYYEYYRQDIQLKQNKLYFIPQIELDIGYQAGFYRYNEEDQFEQSKLKFKMVFSGDNQYWFQESDGVFWPVTLYMSVQTSKNMNKNHLKRGSIWYDEVYSQFILNLGMDIPLPGFYQVDSEIEELAGKQWYWDTEEGEQVQVKLITQVNQFHQEYKQWIESKQWLYEGAYYITNEQVNSEEIQKLGKKTIQEGFYDLVTIVDEQRLMLNENYFQVGGKWYFRNDSQVISQCKIQDYTKQDEKYKKTLQQKQQKKSPTADKPDQSDIPDFVFQIKKDHVFNYLGTLELGKYYYFCEDDLEQMRPNPDTIKLIDNYNSEKKPGIYTMIGGIFDQPGLLFIDPQQFGKQITVISSDPLYYIENENQLNEQTLKEILMNNTNLIDGRQCNIILLRTDNKLSLVRVQQGADGSNIFWNIILEFDHDTGNLNGDEVRIVRNISNVPERCEIINNNFRFIIRINTFIPPQIPNLNVDAPVFLFDDVTHEQANDKSKQEQPGQEESKQPSNSFPILEGLNKLLNQYKKLNQKLQQPMDSNKITDQPIIEVHDQAKLNLDKEEIKQPPKPLSEIGKDVSKPYMIAPELFKKVQSANVPDKGTNSTDQVKLNRDLIFDNILDEKQKKQPPIQGAVDSSKSKDQPRSDSSLRDLGDKASSSSQRKAEKPPTEKEQLEILVEEYKRKINAEIPDVVLQVDDKHIIDLHSKEKNNLIDFLRQNMNCLGNIYYCNYTQLYNLGKDRSLDLLSIDTPGLYRLVFDFIKNNVKLDYINVSQIGKSIEIYLNKDNKVLFLKQNNFSNILIDNDPNSHANSQLILMNTDIIDGDHRTIFLKFKDNIYSLFRYMVKTKEENRLFEFDHPILENEGISKTNWKDVPCYNNNRKIRLVFRDAKLIYCEVQFGNLHTKLTIQPILPPEQVIEINQQREQNKKQKQEEVRQKPREQQMKNTDSASDIKQFYQIDIDNIQSLQRPDKVNKIYYISHVDATQSNLIQTYFQNVPPEPGFYKLIKDKGELQFKLELLLRNGRTYPNHILIIPNKPIILLNSSDNFKRSEIQSQNTNILTENPDGEADSNIILVQDGNQIQFNIMTADNELQPINIDYFWPNHFVQLKNDQLGLKVENCNFNMVDFTFSRSAKISAAIRIQRFNPKFSIGRGLKVATETKKEQDLLILVHPQNFNEINTKGGKDILVKYLNDIRKNTTQDLKLNVDQIVFQNGHKYITDTSQQCIWFLKGSLDIYPKPMSGLQVLSNRIYYDSDSTVLKWENNNLKQVGKVITVELKSGGQKQYIQSLNGDIYEFTDKSQ